MSLGLPILLHDFLGVGEKLAVAVGFATAYVGNILMLRLFVFRSRGSWLGQVSRYVPTNGLFRLAEYLGFLGLFQYVGIDYKIAVIIVLGISFIFKFFAYRWIFVEMRPVCRP